MNALAAWIHTPLAVALGWALLHFLWEGAALALLLGAVLLLLRRASSRARYAIACAVLLAMPVVFGVTFALQLPRLHATVTTPAPSLPAAVAIPLPASTFAPAPALPTPLRARLPWLVPLWLLGVVFFYARALAGWYTAQRLRHRGICAIAPHWQDCLERLRAQLRLSRPVALLESCLTDVPVLIGYLRPVILMPLGCLANLPAGQIECILLHELAHIRRHDYLVNLLQTAVEGLLFYHPAVWWVSATIRAERENCCDDAVVALAGDARAYAATLAALEQRRAPAPALAATGGSLMKRIHRLLQSPRPAHTSAAPAFAAGLLLVSLAAALAAWPAKPIVPVAGLAMAPHALLPAGPPTASGEPYATPATQDVPVPIPAQKRQAKAEDLPQGVATPYRKWLHEDVAYIITDEERAAFLSLQFDPDREKFIEEFWQRRDPSPGTVDNQFREEYYRRIAYANQHFTFADQQGWRSDRGRIYIVYGPPDAIDDLPSAALFPLQRWHYRHIEGVGNNTVVEFVDTGFNKEYRMSQASADRLQAPAPVPAPTPVPDPMAVRVADVLHVSIWEDAHFTGDYTVRPDGKINLPLLGEIAAAGLTPSQVEISINQAAAKLIKSPHANVQLAARKSAPQLFASDSDPGISVVVNPALPYTDGYDGYNAGKRAALVDTGRYQLAADDVVRLSVWEDQHFNGSYVVRPDGLISIPLLGEIAAAGLTSDQLENAVNTAARKYLTVVHSSVQVEKMASHPQRLVTFLVPIDNPAVEFQVSAAITTASHHPVGSWNDSLITGQAVFSRTMLMGPGSFTVTVTRKNLSTGVTTTSAPFSFRVD